MHIPSLTTASLRQLHGRVGWCLAHDDAQAPDRKQYGVREYSDWKRQADEFESELANRSVPFTRIVW